MNRAQVFLAAYRVSGNITRAALAANISRDMHHRRMRTDPAYQMAFAEASEAALRNKAAEAVRKAQELEDDIAFAEQEAYRRGVFGVERTKYWQGTPCGKEIEYSDALLQFLLRGAKPEKYREKYIHEVSGNVDLKFKGSMPQLLDTFRELTREPEE